MSTQDLRAKYEAGNTKQAINRAIRAELVGGPEALDALERINQLVRKHRVTETIEARSCAFAVVAAMEADIRRRYDMPAKEV